MHEDCPIRHHLMIAGTGRAGTSLLVKILSACGLETELDRNKHSFWDAHANAGLETIPRVGGEHPYILKSPWTYQFLDELLHRKEVRLDGLIVPIRDLREAAASRIIIELQNMHRSTPVIDELLVGWRDWGLTPGGMTYSFEPIDQARILGQSLHLLLEKALEHEIPIYLIKFPKFARDPMYLYKSLRGLISSRVDRTQFEEIFHSIVSPEQIRVSSELGEPSGSTAAVLRVAGAGPQFPSLEDLENVALKRELLRVRSESAQASSEIGALTVRSAELRAELAAASSRADIFVSEQKAEIEQRVAAEAALRAEIEQRAATEAAMRAEMEQRAAREAALRDEFERGAETEAVLRNALDRVEREAGDSAARTGVLEADIATIRYELTQAERALDERAATTEALQTELEAVRGTLAVAQRDARERATAAEVLQGRIAALQAQFPASERELRDRTAATEAMQREITSLCSELDAARDVGRAALAVLRTPPAPIPEVPRNAGWTTVMLRRLRSWSSYPVAARPAIADD